MQLRPYGAKKVGSDRFIALQVWEFEENERIYDLAMYLITDRDKRGAETTVIRTKYYAVGTGKLVELMEECHRLLAPGGKLEFVVPYGMSHAYMSDPTHVRPWTETTINYFTKGHASHIYSDCGFTVESLELLDAGPYGTPPGAWRPRLRNLIPFRRYLKFFLFGMYDQMHVVLQKA